MKKLTKIAVLLAAALALTACANSSSSSDDSKDSKGSKGSKQTTAPLLSEAEIAELTVDAAPSDISDGDWIIQEYYFDNNPEAGMGLPEEDYQKILSKLSAEEKAKVESWVNTDPDPKHQQEGYVEINPPYASITSIETFNISLENGKVTVKSGTYCDIYTITDENAVIKKLDNHLDWDGNSGSRSNTIKNEKYEKYAKEIEEDIDGFSQVLKTNAEKNKFYADFGNMKYFLIKQ